jgi:hypothetical protein
VGSGDKVRLDQHLSNIRSIEQRLTSTVVLNCAAPQRPTETEGTMIDRMQAMSDLIALALACDLTRVFSIMFSGSAAGPVFEEIGLTEGHHQLSHEGDAAQAEIDSATIRGRRRRIPQEPGRASSHGRRERDAGVAHARALDGHRGRRVR